jgi:hypothetical protein
VIDERDRVVGSLAPQTVIDTLVGKDARA